jgi:hypothetical protein
VLVQKRAKFLGGYAHSHGSPPSFRSHRTSHVQGPASGLQFNRVPT